MKAQGWGRIVNIAFIHGLVVSHSRAPTTRPNTA
jgi:hypothetical protein